MKKARDADLLCEMIRFAVERLSTLEVGVVTGAACGKTGAACVRETGADSVEPRIPKLRNGSDAPSCPEPRRMAKSEAQSPAFQWKDRPPNTLMPEVCAQGIAIRSVADLVKAMGLSGIARCPQPCKEIDGDVMAFPDLDQGFPVLITTRPRAIASGGKDHLFRGSQAGPPPAP